MIAGKLAHGRHLHLAGVGLGVLDKILERLIGGVFGNHDHVGVVHKAAKRAELFRLVARLPLRAQHGLEHDMRQIHAADGVPVRLCADQPRPADFPARTGLVGYDDGLIENALGEFFKEPVADVAAAARIERGHQGDRLCRILGSLCGNRQEAQRQKRGKEQAFHIYLQQVFRWQLQGVVRDSAFAGRLPRPPRSGG